MGAAQPLNTSISVNQRLRVVRNNSRHASIKALTTPFDTALVSIPGEEIQVIETRDVTFKTDAFRFGHPVVIEPRPVTTMASILSGIPHLSTPVRMIGNPREVQLQMKKSFVTEDIQADARAVSSGKAYTA